VQGFISANRPKKRPPPQNRESSAAQRIIARGYFYASSKVPRFERCTASNFVIEPLSFVRLYIVIFNPPDFNTYLAAKPAPKSDDPIADALIRIRADHVNRHKFFNLSKIKHGIEQLVALAA